MSDRALKDAVAMLAGTFNKDIVSLVACTVTAVDQDARTCDCSPITGDAITDISDVQLMAEVGDGLLLLPSIDSTVIVGLSTRNTAFVLMYSDIDTIIMRGGDLGGIPKIIDLTTKFNNLENLMNDFVSKYNAHTHILTLSSGTGTAAPTTSTETTTLTPTERADIENTNVLHG